MRSPWALLTTRGKLFAILGAVVVAAGVLLGYEDVTRIGLVLVALPVLALVLMPRRTPRIRVLREVEPSRLAPDERGQVVARFTNVGKRPTPLYLAEEHLDFQLGDRPRFVLPRLAPGEDRRLRYAVRSRHRGAYPLGPVLLRQRDPFGLTFLTLQLSSTTEVLVLPRIHALGEGRIRGTSRGSEGEMPQMVALHGEDDVSIRTWRDGDELRRVHWPATAHRGELMVRQEDRPARRRALLILDSRAAAYPGTGVRPSYEWAVSAIASVARHLVADGFVVHLLTDSTLRDGTTEHPVDLDAALDALARVQPEQDSRLDRLAAAAAPFTTGGVLVVAAVVAHDEQALRTLAAIRQPGSRALAFVLDPEKFGSRAETRSGRGAGGAGVRRRCRRTGGRSRLDRAAGRLRLADRRRRPAHRRGPRLGGDRERDTGGGPRMSFDGSRDAFTRGMWPEGLVAALATLAVAWPLTELLREDSWFLPAVVMVGLVGLAGAIMRTLDVPPSLVSLGQLLIGLVGISQVYLRESLWRSLVPTGDTLALVGELLREAGTVLQTYAAPAPTTHGVAFLVVSLMTLTAVSVDSMGVTGRAPASAGIPLAAGFLVSVSNSGRAMEPWYFGAVAVLWLVMLAQQGHRVLAGWPSANRREAHGGDDVTANVPTYRGLSQLLGGLALVAAVVGAAVIPHLPPTFLGDGLARNPEARTAGQGTAQVSFTETMDPSRDLRNQSQAPVLTYRTNATRLEPLRVTATERWDDGEWVAPARPTSGLLPLDAPIPRPAGLGDGVETTQQQVTVTGNVLDVPHLATPYPVSALQLPGDSAYRFDPSDATVVLQAPAEQYTVTYLALAGGGALPEGTGDTPADPEEFDEDVLAVDPVSADTVAELTEEVVGDTQNSLQAAILIQNHLRSAPYQYSLTLAPAAEADSGDPIGGFLETRQGYCVQFATAMVMMARAEGIPARMAVGFLPGQPQVDGTRRVIASDAHTWPELWISGMGWTRFEPTPGIRSEAPPVYARTPANTGDATTTTTTVTRPAAPTTTTPTTAPEDESGFDELVPTLWRTLAGLAVVALLMALVPLVGRRYREEAVRAASTPAEKVEGQWLLLTRSLGDLGVDEPPARSPRDMRRYYRENTMMNRSGEDALGRVTATLERSRYAAPDHLDDEDATRMGADVRTVVEQVREATPWNIRANAALLPQSGLAGVRAWLRGAFRRS